MIETLLLELIASTKEQTAAVKENTAALREVLGASGKKVKPEPTPVVIHRENIEPETEPVTEAAPVAEPKPVETVSDPEPEPAAPAPIPESIADIRKAIQEHCKTRMTSGENSAEFKASFTAALERYGVEKANKLDDSVVAKFYTEALTW